MLKKKHIIGAGLAIAASAALIAFAPNHHVGPPDAYPDSSLTPGVVATTDIHDLTNIDPSCGTYSQCHRQTSQALKAQVEKEYPNCPAQHEIDHLVPLALGGADAQGNLWCQPGTGQWNYHIKDKLEARLVILVKAGTLAPKDAQQCILDDWVSCYQKYFKDVSYGSVDSAIDDPDDVVE